MQPENMNDTEPTPQSLEDALRPAKTGWLQLGVICASEFVIWTGFSGILPYLPIFLKEEGHSSVIMIGFIAAAFYLGTLIFSSPFGWLSDIIGRKPMMIAGMAILTVACFLFTLTVNPRWFLLFRLLEGMSAAAGGVMFAFIADVSVPSQRSRALGLVMSAQFAGAILGPAVSAALYHAGGGGRPGFYAIFYFAAALAGVTTVVMTFLIHEPAATSRRKAVQTEKKPRPSYREILRPAIIGFLVVGFGINFAFGGFEVIWSLWLEHLGASMTMVSVVWIVMSLPMLFSFAGGILADRYNRCALMLGGNTLAALVFLAFGVVRSITVYLVLGFVLGLAFALSSPAKQGFLVQASPVKWIGTVQGLDATSAQLGGMLGTLIVPVMYEAISGYVVAVVGAIALVCFAIATPVLTRESRRQKLEGMRPPEILPATPAGETV
ncbi:MAG: MFS transporter [Thermoleophilia bacterium]|nr:MFS transporter [Thermoleophilia bacterium]